MQLYIVRHGRTQWNEKGLVQGHMDSPLTQEGRQMARDLGNRLSGIPFDKALCSPAGRALATARLMLEGRPIPIVPDARLIERSMGIMEGKPLREAAEKYADDQGFLDIPEAEPLSLIGERVAALMAEVMAEDLHHVLLVSHAITCRALVTVLENGGSMAAFHTGLWLENAQVLHFVFKDALWREEPLA